MENNNELSNTTEVKIVDPYGFIYVTTNNINGKKYIGQRMFYGNWKNYLGSGLLLTRAIKKYGKENFNREIIAVAYYRDELNKLEIEFIKSHNAKESEDYYNIATGGEGGDLYAGHHHSEEAKKKLSEAGKRRNHSEESIQKMRESQKGHPVSDETKSKLSSIALQMSDETKLKMSLSRKGRVVKDETRQKLSKSNKGKVRSNEIKYKMSLSAIEKAKLKKKNTAITNNEQKYNKNNKGFSKEHIDKLAREKKKFNDIEALEIREKYSTCQYSYRQLGLEYNCSHILISHVINFKGAYAKKIT